MCVSNIVLAFAKFEEFWRHYHALVPEEHRAACKALLKAVDRKKIIDFRNRCVGHVWDNKKRRPLVHSEIKRALETMVAPSFLSFLNWINNPKANTYPSTVISVVESVRDALVSAHAIQPAEVVDR